MSTLTDELKKVLANTYSLAIKTQNYHWNVEGPRFRELHLLFEEQYNEMTPAIDEAAEHIRQLGVKAPGSYSAFAELTTIAEANDNLDADGMVQSLLESNEAMVEILSKAHKAAEAEGDEVAIDFLIGRMTAHRKAAWFLRSSLKAAA